MIDKVIAVNGQVNIPVYCKNINTEVSLTRFWSHEHLTW